MPNCATLPATPAPAPVGRRTAARLRLAIPARFVSIYATQPCILLDISRTGARLALATPLAEGMSGLIAIARCEAFGTIVRTEHGPDGGVNAMVFDEPIGKAQVLDLRHFAENFDQRERSALRDQARRWVTGHD